MSALIRMAQSSQGRLSAWRRKQYFHLPADFQLSPAQPSSSQDSVTCSFASASSALDTLAGRWKGELRPSATSLFDRSR